MTDEFLKSFAIALGAAAVPALPLIWTAIKNRILIRWTHYKITVIEGEMREINKRMKSLAESIKCINGNGGNK